MSPVLSLLFLPQGVLYPVDKGRGRKENLRVHGWGCGVAPRGDLTSFPFFPREAETKRPMNCSGSDSHEQGPTWLQGGWGPGVPGLLGRRGPAGGSQGCHCGAGEGAVLGPPQQGGHHPALGSLGPPLSTRTPPDFSCDQQQEDLGPRGGGQRWPLLTEDSGCSPPCVVPGPWRPPRLLGEQRHAR